MTPGWVPAVLQSGTTIDLPKGQSELKRQISDDLFSDSPKPLDIHIAVPFEEVNIGSLSGNGHASHQRYLPESVQVYDENSADNAREIIVGKKNIRLLLGNESADNCERLKIAELERTAEGELALSEAYVPPCLILSASTPLQKIVRQVISEIEARQKALLRSLPRVATFCQLFFGPQMPRTAAAERIHFLHGCLLRRCRPGPTSRFYQPRRPRHLGSSSRTGS